MVLRKSWYPHFCTFCPGNDFLTAVQEIAQEKLAAICLVRTLPPLLYGNFLCSLVRNSASDQLNALVGQKRYVGHEKKIVLVNSLFTQILIIVPLYGCF